MSDQKHAVSYRLPARLRVLVLAFLVGSLLSLLFRGLVGMGLTEFHDSEPFFKFPGWAYNIYYANCVVCFILLPFWTSFFLKDQPEARQVGRVVWITFRLLLLFVLLLLLLPSPRSER
jgi:hypothetical protein